MFLVDLKSRVPIYEQLKNKTLELIMLGILSPGDKMPSVRSLASQLGVNPNTIQKAYQDMEREGIIYTVSGRGSFVCDDVHQKEFDNKDVADRLEKSIYEARLYGFAKETVIKTVEEIYNRGAEK